MRLLKCELKKKWITKFTIFRLSTKTLNTSLFEKLYLIQYLIFPTNTIQLNLTLLVYLTNVPKKIPKIVYQINHEFLVKILI